MNEQSARSRCSLQTLLVVLLGGAAIVALTVLVLREATPSSLNSLSSTRRPDESPQLNSAIDTLADALALSERQNADLKAALQTLRASVDDIRGAANALRSGTKLQTQSSQPQSQPQQHTVSVGAATTPTVVPSPHAYDIVQVALPGGETAPTLIEPLTESLRSPQWDLTPRFDMLEHRGFLLMLPSMLPPRKAQTRWRRTILVDIGTREFASSMAWFLSSYPIVFDAIYAFEMTPNTFVVPPVARLRSEYGNRARAFERKSFHFYNALVSTLDMPAPPAHQAKTPMTDAEIDKIFGASPQLCHSYSRGVRGL